MASVIDLRRQIDIVDRQIVELLSRRTNVVKQVMNHLEEDEVDTDREQQVLANWLEEGFDYDLDEGALEKVCKAVMELGKKSKDR
jgi:chorismate mutase